MNNPYQLYAPPPYWAMTPEVREALEINGCGPRGLFGVLVPDTVYGLSISPACDIHDYMYIVGMDDKDKDEADRVFRNNMLRIIMAHRKSALLFHLRLRRIRVYYEAVEHYGGVWFWKDKNPPETLGLVIA